MNLLKLAAFALALSCCGPMPSQCPSPSYPSPAPGGLCCDARWEWCLAADGRVVGAP